MEQTHDNLRAGVAGHTLAQADALAVPLSPGPASAPPMAATSYPGRPAASKGFLALALAGCTCVVPLSRVREVLPGLPEAAALPDSPAWLLGLFPRRSDLLALIDPLPVLIGQPMASGGPWRMASRSERRADEAAWSTPHVAASGVATVGGRAANDVAVVLTDDTRCIAIAVHAIGPILPSVAGIPPATDSAPARVQSEDAAPLLARYVAGSIVAGEAGTCVVLRVEALLNDVMAALSEQWRSPDV